MTKYCEFKNRVCTESILTNEGSQSVLELIDRFLSKKEDQSGPISACDETPNPNRHTGAFRVAEVLSTSGVFHICSKCREAVRKHLNAMGVI
jgi:hypothetical protein